MKKEIGQPLSVCWNVTSKCNLKCKFCFGPKDTSELSLKDGKKIIKKLAEGRVKKITFTGGEPLLKEDIIELIKYSKKKKLITALSTNGILLNKKKLKELKGYIDWIYLPLDGPNSKVHDSLRGLKGHFEIQLKNIKEVLEEGINLKITTVVSKKNIKEIDELGNLLVKSNVKNWKLFQFSPRGIGRKYKTDFSISKNKFGRLKDKILKKHSKINIDFASNDYIERSYFLISSDGTVYTPHGEKNLFAGNLLEDEMEKVWSNQIFDYEKHERNYGKNPFYKITTEG